MRFLLLNLRYTQLLFDTLQVTLLENYRRILHVLKVYIEISICMYAWQAEIDGRVLFLFIQRRMKSKATLSVFLFWFSQYS